MSKIILYSDFKPGVSTVVDHCLLDLLHGTRCRFGYIPSDSDLKRRYFAKIQDRYAEIGITDLTYFDLGDEYAAAALPRLMECDAIYLSGGDPFRFLSLIKKRNFTTHIKAYLKKGGILIGVSAGAMILSKSLGLADDDWIKDLTRAAKPQIKGLGVFDFEFYPHFKGDAETIRAIAEYEKRHRTKIWACDDDAGLFIQNGTIQTLGSVYVTQ